MNIKRKGLLLLDAAISAIILGIAAMSFVMLYSSQFALLSAGKDGKTAMQYAEVDAEILKTLSYQDIKDDDILGEALLHQERGQLLSVPDADGWQDEIIYGDEHHIASNDSDYTVATVNIYRDGDTLPRATLKVPLSSETNGKGEAVGSIVARLSTEFATQGEKGKYLFCDGSIFDTNKYPKLYKVLGSNKLPNLQGMFLRGYGSQSFSQNNGIVAEGGNNTTYKSDEVGKIQGDASRHLWACLGTLWSTSNLGWGNVFGINATEPVVGMAYAICPTSPSQSSGAHVALLASFPTIKAPGKNTVISSTLQYADANRGAIHNDGWTELGRKFGEDLNKKQNIRYTYENVAMDYYLDSKRVLPTANEIRPVNVAVRYYIKAK